LALGYWKERIKIDRFKVAHYPVTDGCDKTVRRQIGRKCDLAAGLE
jgi:hypothetical protein